MADSLTLIDMLLRGIAVGAMAVIGLCFLASDAARNTRVVTALFCLSIVLWLVAESETLAGILHEIRPLYSIGAYPVAGLFWLFAVVVFDDQPLTLPRWLPALVLLFFCLIRTALSDEQPSLLWAVGNVFSGLLSAHVVWIIARGWSGDLLEPRRWMRGAVLGFAGLLAVTNVALALANSVEPNRSWQMLMTGGPLGVALLALLMLSGSVLFLQPRLAVFSVSKPVAVGPDPRAEAAERTMLESLNGLMAAGGWRREGLTIGGVAQELDVPEHRLRRLINQRLDHRNFADFVNSYRIEAAKARLEIGRAHV